MRLMIFIGLFMLRMKILLLCFMFDVCSMSCDVFGIVMKKCVIFGCVIVIGLFFVICC